MDKQIFELVVEIETRQNLEAGIETRPELTAEISTREILDTSIETRQELIVEVGTRVVEDGYYATVTDETLHLVKGISVAGDGLILNG